MQAVDRPEEYAQEYLHVRWQAYILYRLRFVHLKYLRHLAEHSQKASTIAY